MSGDSLDDGGLTEAAQRATAGKRKRTTAAVIAANSNTQPHSQPQPPSPLHASAQPSTSKKRKRSAPFDDSQPLTAAMLYRQLTAPTSDVEADAGAETAPLIDAPSLSELLSSALSASTRRTVKVASPVCFIVCSSAERCLGAFKEARDALKDARGGEIAKAFARHIKLREAVASFSSSRPSIVVGTPQRLAALIGAGALKLDALTLMAVDGARDVKRYTIATLPIVRDQLRELSDSTGIKQRISEKRTKLAVFAAN